MKTKPLALIVDDKEEWLRIFEEVLEPTYQVKKARTLGEANTFIESNGKKIAFALVDIRLREGPDPSGVSVLQSLKSYHVPSVATSAFYDDDAKAVRDALVLGEARGFWFKATLDVPHLSELIDEARTIRPMSKETRPFIPWFFPLIVVITVAGLFLLVLGPTKSASNLPAIVGGTISLAALVLVFAYLREPLRSKDALQVLLKLLGR